MPSFFDRLFPGFAVIYATAGESKCEEYTGALNVNEREQVLAQIQHLAVTGPDANCNTPDCPLYELRKLAAEERMEWVRSLSDEDLAYMATYHQICLQWMHGDATLGE